MINWIFTLMTLKKTPRTLVKCSGLLLNNVKRSHSSKIAHKKTSEIQAKK